MSEAQTAARGWIYFVQCGEWGPIKIGHATSGVAARVRDLQVGCPFELRIVGVVAGSLAEEQALHQVFASSWVRGEWFRPDERVLEFIADYSDDDEVKRARCELQRRTRGPKRQRATQRAISKKLSRGRPLSNRELARRLGVSHTLINRRIAERERVD